MSDTFTKYTVIAPPGATFNPGQVLRLTQNQMARRAHALKRGDRGVCQVTKTIMFKYGEEIEVSGGVSKTALQETAPSTTAAAKTVSQETSKVREKANAKAAQRNSNKKSEEQRRQSAKDANKV